MPGGSVDEPDAEEVGASTCKDPQDFSASKTPSSEVYRERILTSSSKSDHTSPSTSDIEEEDDETLPSQDAAILNDVSNGKMYLKFRGA